MRRKLLLKAFREKGKETPTYPGINESSSKTQKDSTTNIGKLMHKVQNHQQKAAVGAHDLLSEIRHIKNIEN